METNTTAKKAWYKTKLFKGAIVVLVTVAVVAAIFLTGQSYSDRKYEALMEELRLENKKLKDEAVIVWDVPVTTEITVDLLESKIQDIGELATVEYLYTDAGRFEDAKQLFGGNIPFTTKSFIAKWDGVIKAGVKIDEILVEVNDADKEIVVHIPAAVILSHEVDSGSIETLDEKDGLFNPVKVDDVRQFDAVSKETMEQRAIENGILTQALENAKGIIEALLISGDVQEQGYTVRFETVA